ncbi:DUF2254 domain-containing protein [Arenimonas donghaensis]|uniref:DUF2254 domain-containing protein n=1 Tax=Arenimonas donghaensis DSM 18148 = HO3-R19 TaxID=1121014 RepID=A0A087MKL7_9GAMM|nr:DUF2254 domain-containing protein [Arenimonas donghaensis]KFL37420.1 hypothetical protein N788_09510 [Arenimonas donghaensis DSM 18148 = HO3-R19]
MIERLRSLLRSLRQRLWAKPLAACLLSVVGVGLASALDNKWLMEKPPEVSAESIESLLSIIASSMLVIAIFAAGAMVSAYASASNNASPRSFPLVLADDVSQNAYSIFVGAFIFGVVGLVALQNNSFGTTGRFVLFIETALVFAMVILTFVRWVDRIARLGRQGNTIDQVEQAAADAIRRYRRRAGPGDQTLDGPHSVVAADTVGYLQEVKLEALQACAEASGQALEVLELPGAFIVAGQPLLRAYGGDAPAEGEWADRLRTAFRIGSAREFDEDPRFGLVVLSEIAGRALSPAVNDPGTAIDVLGRIVRLFTLWEESGRDPPHPPCAPAVRLPALTSADLVEDAFTATARDGAGSIEVVCRLLKALEAVADLGDTVLAGAARQQAREALAMAEAKLPLPEHVERARHLARFAAPSPQA